MENIYIEPDEEIVSIIDKLIKAESEEVNLVVPIGAQLWQSSINLRLLKREADNSDKKVTLIVPNGLDIEAAEKIGFDIKKEKDIPVEMIQEEQDIIEETRQSKKNMISYLIKELKPGERLSKPFAFLKSKRNNSESSLSNMHSQDQKRKMADIINPIGKVKVSSPYRPFPEKKPEIEKAPLLEEVKEEIFPNEQEPSVSKWPKFFFAFIIIAILMAGLVS